MVFLADLTTSGGRFHVVSLNTRITAAADRAVEFVVVLSAVGPVVMDIEIGGCERGLAGLADEAQLVVAATEAAIGTGN